ncbi:ANTAR domain-containing protein [Geodermatophilus sabuli]|uniref:PAS fold-containing protein n=1 Tax=Geodermatophilus sabuli TaxID=1564158 RepID=A0A285EJR8_9ACTN|nr:ANTAR domain-containing protein [Geodermatophilus sabuli]MBB3083673.1 GAF domain-containing protein [Geodermatophilus sabuli]SNX99103.1 PAS fold-containing protein [Geodermatophilus sabuli]
MSGPDGLGAGEALDTLAELQVAHEELRVAEEEVRVQQEQIQQLLNRYEAERRWRGHLSAVVPVGLCITDGDGKVLDANPALAQQLHVPLSRLRGKPFSVFLSPADVRSYRSALRALGSGQAREHHSHVLVRGRGPDESPVSLFGFPELHGEPGGDTRIQWVLIPAGTPDGDADAGSRSVEAESLGLATALAELSSLPLAEGHRQELMGRMAVLVRSAVPAAGAVSISLGSPLAPQVLGSDSTAAQTFDGRQMQAGEGPCWNAYSSGEAVVTGDVDADPRWPVLARTAADGTVRSVLAIPLPEDGVPAGVLNVYSADRNAFDATGLRIAELVAAAVSGVLQTVAERESLRTLAANLEKALTSRAVIDQAKGVLMARLGVGADDAFARLVTLSNRLNVKLRDLAQLVVEGHADEVIAAGR